DRNLNKNKSNSLDEFKVFLKKKDKYYNIITDIKTKDALLDKELGKYKLEDLEEDLRDYMERDIEIGETRSSDQLENDRSKKFNEISEVKADISAIGERLDYLNRELKRLVEIDEEIERKENSIAEMDKKKKAIELAKDTIQSLSKDIHRQFAPTINKKVGEIINTITNGKYKRVRIDDKLEMRILNPITEEMI